jgi:hypothetical protein
MRIYIQCRNLPRSVQLFLISIIHLPSKNYMPSKNLSVLLILYFICPLHPMGNRREYGFGKWKDGDKYGGRYIHSPFLEIEIEIELSR